MNHIIFESRSLFPAFSKPPRVACFLFSFLLVSSWAYGQSPSGYWTFNNADIAGLTALDRSGNNLSGTISNATSVTGIIGQALNFNGSNASVLVPNDGQFAQLGTNLTVAFWINTTNATRTEAAISKYLASGQETGYLIHTTPSGTMAIRLGGNNTPSNPLRETFDTTHINDGQWHHIAIVMTLGQGLTFYVDGNLSSNWPMNIVSATTAAPFYFGTTDYSGYGANLTGSLDEVYLFQQALTSAQVFALYANSAAGPGTVISNVQISNLSSSGATITWNTSTATDTQLAYGLTGAYGAFTTLAPAPTQLHTVNLSGLQPSTQYHFRAQSRDGSGVLAVSGDATLSTQAQTQASNIVVDTTVSDFSSGTNSSTYVSQIADGEVMLQPSFGTEFSGNALPPGWSTTIWQGGGFANVGNGLLSLSAAKVTGAAVSPGRSIEFVATFTQDPDEHIGFAVDLSSPPWAIFSTKSNRAMNIRTNNGAATVDQLISGNFVGSAHKYRIDWSSSAVVYSIDDVQVGTHSLGITTAMSPIASNNFTTNGILNVDWLHLTPYASAGTFTSRVLDANVAVGWSTASWTATLPPGTTLAMSVRIGNTPIPDGTWTAFQPVSGSGGAITGSGRYIQYRATLSTSDPSQTPVLSDVTLLYNGSLSNIGASNITPTSASINWSSNTPADSQVDYGVSNLYGSTTPLNSTLVTSHSVPLSNLTPSTGYHFRVKSNNGNGTVTSGDYTFNTPAIPDVTPPNIYITAPPAGAVAGKVTISANATDNVGVVSVQFVIDNVNFGSPLLAPTVSPSTYQIVWDTTTVGNGPHTLSAFARDAAGNTGTAAAVSVTAANPTTFTLVDTTVADFAAGSGTNTYVSAIADGEVIQNPTLGTEFSFAPPSFSAQPWASGGSVTVANGVATVDGALYATNSYYAPGTSLQFVTTFSGDFNQHAGFGTSLATQPWAIFSTAGGGTTLYIRTNNGSQSLMTALAGNYMGSPHQFRIDWTGTGFVYLIDGQQVGIHAAPIGQNMRPVISDASPGGGVVTVDWLHVSPYASPATFTSRVLDAGTVAGWNALSWDAIVPANASLNLSYRTGSTPAPDGSWTAFIPVAASGASINASSRYIQYRAVLSSTDATQTVVLQDVKIQYNTTFSNVHTSSVTTTGATIAWNTSSPSTSQVEYGTSLSYGASFPVPADSSMVTTHSVTLAGLQSGTLYHYRVKSNDGTNLNVSTDYTFTIPSVPDVTPPAISMTSPAAGAVSNTVTVSANASDNVGVTSVQFLLNGNPLGTPQAGLGPAPATYSIQWDSTNVVNGPYTLAATAFDAAGNHTTATGIAVTVSNSLIKTIKDTTVADFSAGTGTNFYISQMNDGEVIQAPAAGSEFTTFPSGWTAAAWSTGGAVTLSGGIANVDGAELYANSSFSPVRSLEFMAKFAGDYSQHAGLGVDFLSAPWAIFSTYTGGALYARTNNGTQNNVTLIPGNFLGSFHKYRIDWTAGGFVYSVDDNVVLTDPLPIGSAMRPIISDAVPGGGSIGLDWLHLTPYAAAATFTSRVIDALGPVNWGTLSWSATLPAGTSIAFSVRTGNTPVPDGTWTAFTPIGAPGGNIGGNSRYIQYQAQFTTTVNGQTAVLNDVTVAYSL